MFILSPLLVVAAAALLLTSVRSDVDLQRGFTSKRLVADAASVLVVRVVRHGPVEGGSSLGIQPDRTVLVVRRNAWKGKKGETVGFVMASIDK